MKVLAPAVTCLLVSHLKPTLGEAIASVLAQTRRDIALVVVDSGQWIGSDSDAAKGVEQAYQDFAGHPLVEWVTTGEAPGLAGRRCPVGWATNTAIRAGLVRGRYMCTFYDDDLYLPRFMEVMAGYLDSVPDARAVWCTQERVALHPQHGQVPGSPIYAGGAKSPGQMDCQVDGAQVMWRREMLDAIGDPWIPEDPGTCSHSDGIFLEKLAAVCGTIHPVAETLCTHRFTPWSTYTPAR